MNWLRREKSDVAMSMPETSTEENICSTTPPTTQMGIEAKHAPNLPKRPRQMSQKPQAKPAEREAHLVSAIRPLFCEKVVLGGEPKRHARKELTPSARRPPWMREEMSASYVTPE